MTVDSVCHAGFHHGLRQPDQILTIRLGRCPPAIDWERFDSWLSEKLAIPVRPTVAGGASGHEPTRLMGRILQVAAALQYAAHVPVFEPGRILSCDADPAREGAWIFRVAVAHVDFMAAGLSSLAYDTATTLVLEVAADPARFAQAEALYRQLREHVVQPLQEALPAGKSTIHLLRTAHECGIPWRHLGHCVFLLGWGRHALRTRHGKVETDALLGAHAAQHKFMAAQWMRQMGLPAPEHRLVVDEEGALEAAKQLGWPLVVKPADRDRGEGVTVDVGSGIELRGAFQHALGFSKQILVERMVPGVCHRVLVVRGRVLYTVRRQPVSVEGDGRKTVAECIQAANARQQSIPVWDRPPPYPSDELACASLGRAGLTMASIPAPGTWAPLRPIESTEWGGRDEDFSETLHADNVAIAIQAASLFGLDVAGVDIISPDITRPWHENGAIINEVNAAPVLGASQSSLDTLPTLMARLVTGDGRIPIEAVVGAGAAWPRARARQRYWTAQGRACYVTSHAATEDASGQSMPLALSGLFARCMALLMNRRVEALVLLVQTDELLETGLPVDRLDRVERIPDELVSSRSGRQATREATDRLHRFLSAALKIDI